MVSKQKSIRYTEHFVCLKWKLKKKLLPENCVSRATHIRWMEIRLKEGRKKNFESKYHDTKVKSLKQRSTLACIFSHAEEEKIKNERSTKCGLIVNIQQPSNLSILNLGPK